MGGGDCLCAEVSIWKEVEGGQKQGVLVSSANWRHENKRKKRISAEKLLQIKFSKFFD